MNLVDSCGWLEYFADGPNADFYAAAIEDTGSLLVPTICLIEVFKRVFQQRGELVRKMYLTGYIYLLFFIGLSRIFSFEAIEI